MDSRKEYMMTLIILSRVNVEACSPFLEGIPEDALHDSDHGWWTDEERGILYEAMQRTLVELRS